jgi:hypothetical protein
MHAGETIEIAHFIHYHQGFTRQNLAPYEAKSNPNPTHLYQRLNANIQATRVSIHQTRRKETYL